MNRADIKVGAVVRKLDGNGFGPKDVPTTTIESVGECWSRPEVWFTTGTFLYEDECVRELTLVSPAPKTELEVSTSGQTLGNDEDDRLSGGSNGYYMVDVEDPTSEDNEPYTAECNDIIEALEMTPAEANVFKAIWRKAAQRQGNGKPGNDALYDAEKMVFFSNRELINTKRKS